jgi:hypothetical protein
LYVAAATDACIFIALESLKAIGPRQTRVLDKRLTSVDLLCPYLDAGRDLTNSRRLGRHSQPTLVLLLAGLCRTRQRGG